MATTDKTWLKDSTGWLLLNDGVTHLGTGGGPPPPPPVGNKEIGVYQASSNTTAENGTLPRAYVPNMNLGSFYLGWNVAPSSTLIPTWAAAGLSLQIEIQTGTQTTYGQIADGSNDASLITKIKYLDGLGVPVRLALENEAETRSDSIPTDSNAANFKAAASHFADLIHANASKGNVEAMIWFAGYEAASQSLAWLPPLGNFKHISWDLYKTGTHPVSETAGQTFSPFIQNVLKPAGWTTDKVDYHISESGIVVTKFTSQQQMDWWDTLEAGLDDNNIKSFIYFRDNSGGKPWVATDMTVDAHIASVLNGLAGT